MWKLSVFAVMTIVLAMLSGCKNGEDPEKSLSIFLPQDGDDIDFVADDSNADLEGLNVNVYVDANNFAEGDMITLTAGGASEELEYNTSPVIFRDFNLGTEEGSVAIVAAGGGTTHEITVNLVGLAPPCPEVQINQPGDDVILQGEQDVDAGTPGFQYTILVSSSAEEGSVAELYVDDSPSGITAIVTAARSATFQNVTLSEGTHSYRVQIVDAHESCEWPEIEVTVDTDAPECNITDPGSGIAILNMDEDADPLRVGMQRDVTVETDAGGSIEVRLFVDGVEIESGNTGSGDLTFEGVALAEGDRSLHAECTDGAGNLSQSAFRAFFVDTLPPDLRIVSPDDGGYITDANDGLPELDGIQFAVNVVSGADDVEDQEVRGMIESASPLAEWGTSTMSDGTGTIYVDASHGTWNVVAELEDAAGNESSATISVSVDTAEPQVQIIDPVGGSVLTPPMDTRPGEAGMQYTVIACASEDGAADLLSDGESLGAAWRIEASPCETPAITLDYTITFEDVSLPEGTQLLTVEFSDLAGIEVFSPDVEIVVDTVPPECSLFAPICGSTVSSLEMPIDVQLRVSHAATLSISHPDHGTYVELSSEPGPGGFITFRDVGLEIGTNQVSCESTDEHGVTYVTPEGSCSLEVAADYLIDITSPAAGAVLGAVDDADPGAGYAIEVCARSGTVPEGTMVHFEVDAVEGATMAIAAGEACANVAIESGEHVLHVWADVDGSLAEDSSPVVIDLTPPEAVEGLSAEILVRREASLRLHWTTPGEEVEAHLVRWSHDPIEGPADFAAAHDVSWDAGVTAADTLVAFDINDLAIERGYYVAVRPIDGAGNAGEITATDVAVRPSFQTQVTAPGPGGTIRGMILSPAGDLDGDEIDDFIVGSGNNGYIFFGPLPEDAEMWTPDTAISVGGWATAVGVDDFNGDGHADIAVGAPFSASSVGNLYIFFGGPDRTWGATVTAASADVVVAGIATGGRFGWSVAGVGDFCGDADGGDGFMDVAIAAPYAESGTGHVYIVCGADIEPGLETSVDGDDLTILQVSGTVAGVAAPSFGVGLAGLGDINTDGYDDLALGHFRHGNGEVYVLRGMSTASILSETPLTTDDELRVQTLEGEGPEENFGNRVAGLGDFNNDGSADLVVGAGQNEDFGDNAGKVYVYLGGAGGWLDPEPATIVPTYVRPEGSEFGYCVGFGGAGFGGGPDRSLGQIGRGGDVADLLIISTFASGTAGWVVGVFGAAGIVEPGGELTTHEIRDNPDTGESNDGVGFLIPVTRGDPFTAQHVVAYVGDVDGDGYEDFAVTDMSVGGWGGQVMIYY